MVKIWLYAIVSVFIVSLMSLIGILTLSENRLKKNLLLLVSFAVGALLGGAFIHLIPESFEKLGSRTSLYVVLGILIFFVLERCLRWRHCHITTSVDHPHPVAIMNLVGDAIHNLMDGIIIGVSYLISPSIGMTTTLAIILHEIPQEMGDFGILIYGGFSKRRALFFNFLSALTAVFGTVLSLIIGRSCEGYATFLLPIAAGGFLYIAGSDLVPELHRHEVKILDSLQQIVAIVFGVGVMALLVLLEK